MLRRVAHEVLLSVLIIVMPCQVDKTIHIHACYWRAARLIHSTEPYTLLMAADTSLACSDADP